MKTHKSDIEYNLMMRLVQFNGSVPIKYRKIKIDNWLAEKRILFVATTKGLPSIHVFLPAAGNRNGSSVNNVSNNGNYWSSTPNGSNNANNFYFNSNNVNLNNNNRYNGQSVRLVQHSSN